MSSLPDVAKARVKACCASAAIIFLSISAINVITDRSRLKQQLAEQSAALVEAQEAIQLLQVKQLAPGHKAPSPSSQFFAERRAQQKKGSLAAAVAATMRGAAAAGLGTASVSSSAAAEDNAELRRSAAVITNPTCRARWLEERRAAAALPETPHVAPLPFAGGDLEAPGVFEAALAARAPGKELIFLSVGDTRDHRRQYKDPSLRTISIDFLRNLLGNLKRLRIGHYLILTTQALCARLQQEHCEYSCAWTSLWHSHPGLPAWNLKPGDMFLMWAQQWRYIARAMELNYRVMRSDTDVYLAEDPYPILKGPLFSRFQMVVQHDFFGSRERPRCDRAPRAGAVEGSAGGLPTCGFRNPGLALLNIGLVYLRSSPGGGVFSVINGTWARFLERLSGPPSKPAHLRGAVDSQALIDQPFMRSVVNDLAVADRRFFPPKRPDQWAVVPGDAGETYAAGSSCALTSPAACAAVAAERRKTAFLVQTVRSPAGPGAAPRRADGDELVALAPDWLFGRGCLTHLRAPLELLKQAHAAEAASGQCAAPPSGPGRVPLAPGPSGGLLVATHFVYSMALKRKRAFRAFGWDLADERNRTLDGGDGRSCFKRSNRAMLFGHTIFDQTAQTKSVLCALPSGNADDSQPACPCCAGLPSMQRLSGGRAGYRLETTGGAGFNSPGHFPALEGCNDYQVSPLSIEPG